jgi:hypothetical protein
MNPNITRIAGTVAMIAALPIAVLILSLEPGAQTHRQEADAAAAQSAEMQRSVDDGLATLDADIAAAADLDHQVDDAIATAQAQLDADPAVTYEAAAPQPAITMATFTSLTTGMSYADVVALFGTEGTLLSEVTIGGSSSAMYMWSADCCTLGANLNVMFQNGRLISKAQYGLA